MARLLPEHCDPWGRPVVPPEQLTREERIALLQKAAESLRAGKVDAYAAKWLGVVLQEHLATGASMEALLGTKPARGSTRTPARIAAAERHSALLLKFSGAVGSDREAARVLAGKAPCPAGARALLQELAASDGPKSLAAFSRARGVSRHRV